MSALRIISTSFILMINLTIICYANPVEIPYHRLYKKFKRADVDVLIKDLTSLDARVRKESAYVLGEKDVHAKKAVPDLCEALFDSDKDVRREAAMALNKISDPRSIEPFIKALGDKEKEVRSIAAFALGRFGGSEAVAPLRELLADSSDKIEKEEISKALAKLGWESPDKKKSAKAKSSSKTLPIEERKEPLPSDIITQAPKIMPAFPMIAGDHIMIMWVPVPKAVRFNIYHNGKFIGEAEKPPFTHKKPDEYGTHKYSIAGVDTSGNEGPHSEDGTLTLIELIQPKGFSYRFLGGKLNLRWDIVQNAVVYHVYRSESKHGPFRLLSSIYETRYVDNDVSFNGMRFHYFYKIVSMDKFNFKSTDTEINEVMIDRI